MPDFLNILVLLSALVYSVGVMSTKDWNLKSLLDIPEWEKVQDKIAKCTGTAVITIDYKGIPVSKHSERTDFCTVIRDNPVSRKRCYKCDALAGLEAVRNGEPFIYLCHCGIVDVAVPIMVGDRYLGAVMFGQVRIPNDGSDSKVERLVNEISTFEADNEVVREDLLEKYNQLPEMSYQKILETAELIDSIIHYIVDRAIKIHNINVQLEYKHQSSLPPVFDGWKQGDAVLDDLIKRPFPPRQTDYDSESKEEHSISSTSPIYPAILYIFEHNEEMPAMSQMAKLCHLSSSYFSKVFLREAGENYTDYLHREKIKKAKEKLGGSESIGQISITLGYQDTSYFVKVFRKYEGITPSEYIKSKRKSN